MSQSAPAEVYLRAIFDHRKAGQNTDRTDRGHVEVQETRKNADLARWTSGRYL